MSSTRYCPSCLASITARVSSPSINARSSLRLPVQQVRTAKLQATVKSKGKKAEQTKPKKTRSHFFQPDLKKIPQYSLVDAMRYLRAAEVGRPPTQPKYELHVRLRTVKNGAVVRDRMRLPHPLRNDLRVCVIAPADSPAGKAAKAAGAVLVGEEEIFTAVKNGQIEFDRCVCAQTSIQRLNQSGVARILGPRGLMPSAKRGTVVKDVGSIVREMIGGSEYRERLGVVRMAIGQIGFTPSEMQKNIRAFIAKLNKDMLAIGDRTSKAIHEVVLSSTNGPGLSLSGELKGPATIPEEDLSTL